VEVSKVFLFSGNAGQGKTTIAKNIAFALRNFGYDVLLVDADLKTPKMGHHVGMPLVARTIQDVLLGFLPLTSAIYRKPSGLKLLLSSLTEVKTPHPSTLLQEIKRLADIIIIDTPTHDVEWYKTGCETIFVTQPDFPSILDVKKMFKGANVNGIIVNRARHNDSELSPGNVQQFISQKILGIVPEEPSMWDALKHGHSIVEFHPELNTSCILKQIAAKLMNLEYHPPARSMSLLAKLGLTQ